MTCPHPVAHGPCHALIVRLDHYEEHGVVIDVAACSAGHETTWHTDRPPVPKVARRCWTCERECAGDERVCDDCASEDTRRMRRARRGRDEGRRAQESSLVIADSRAMN